MYPGEGSHNYGIFNGLDALGQEAPASSIASRLKAGAIDLKPVSLTTAAIFTGGPSEGGAMQLLPDAGGATVPGVEASAGGNGVIYVGLAVAALAIGGALYVKKRRKAA